MSEKRFMKKAVISCLCLATANVWAYDSDSTGADGAFAPVVDTEVQLPADGVFNYTTVNIPAGVTVTFAKNALNTPVVWLASGDVTIAGTIDVSGTASADVGSAGNGNIGDDGQPGIGGPGGFDGGRGGQAPLLLGSAGQGPGGGGPAKRSVDFSNSNGTVKFGCGGAGAGYGAAGNNSTTVNSSTTATQCALDAQATGGNEYGNTGIRPMIGGSGGGGASAGGTFSGSGGGGGGGAILIASSGTVNVTGSILANSGNSGTVIGANVAGGTGGAGSGGAIRIVATALSGNGVISAIGATPSRPLTSSTGSQNLSSTGGLGSVGRIRIEVETLTRTAVTTPIYTVDQPQDLFVAGLPSVRITSVAGVAAPQFPTGNADITLPESTANPVAIEFATTGVPTGNTVELVLIPASGVPSRTLSGALTGTEAAATSSVSVDLPDGPSLLQAQVTYTVTVAQAEQFAPFADGNMVASVRLTSDLVHGSQTTFITESGKEYTWPSSAVAIN